MMTIPTKPGEIFDGIVRPVFIYVMHYDYSLIFFFTEKTYRLLSTRKQYLSVLHIPSSFPQFVLVADILLISPYCLAGFGTEEFFTLGVRKLF